MENLDRTTQFNIVEKVLKEMNHAKEYVEKNWNASWQEEYQKAYSRTLRFIPMNILQEEEDKHNNIIHLENVYNNNSNNRVPLARIRLNIDGEYHECLFGEVDWVDMNSNQAKRRFSFDHDGNIEYVKISKQKNKPSYITNHNITNNNLEIKLKKDKNFISIKNTDKELIKQYNEVKIIKDYETGEKTVIINPNFDKRKRHLSNKQTTYFEARFDSDNNLENAYIKIDTHRKDGKVNGTYRLDASWLKGIRANFYSRKGKKYELSENNELSENFSNLLLPTLNSDRKEDEIVKSFFNAIKKVCNNEIDKNDLFFENQFFNISQVDKIEDIIDEELKNIRGEIPIRSLTDRLNNTIYSRNQDNYYYEYRPTSLKKKEKKQSLK